MTTMTDTATKLPVITAEQRAALDRDGYFVLENVFTRDEMDALAERIETHLRVHQEKIRAMGGTQGISRADQITFTDHLAEHDPHIKEFVMRPEFVAITTQLLGPDVILYWNQSVFKWPEGTQEFPWHQDDGYSAVTPSPYLTIWLALNDATPENGCISVLPGSHKRGLVPHEPSPIGKICHPSDDPDQGIRVPVPAGGMAIFWSLTMHKSGANVSKGPRKAYVIQYAHYGLRRVTETEPLTDRIVVAWDGKPAREVAGAPETS